MKLMVMEIMDHLLGTIKALSKTHVENCQMQYCSHLKSINSAYCMDVNS